MKKIFCVLMLLMAYGAMQAADELFNEGRFEFLSSNKNTRAEECPMSPYKKGSIVFFRNDTAYMFYPKMDLELDTPIVCRELMGLGIKGTFAYDKGTNKLYFSKADESGEFRLYEATADGNNWTDVRPMKIKGVMATRQEIKGSSLAVGRWSHSVKGSSGFYNPTIAKGGRRIYFSGAFVSGGRGNRDIWYTDKEQDGLWSRPVNLGDSINTPGIEDYALCVADTILYFASNKPGGNGDMDIYYAKKAKKDTAWVSSPINLEHINSNAADYNVAFNKVSAYFISNRKGGKGKADIYRPMWINPYRDKELMADRTIEEPKGFHWVLFFFDFNKSDMKPEYEAQLDELAKAMKEFPGAKFEISGHTDARGSAEYNQKLSQKRAEYVRSLLVKRGFNGDDIVAIGKGMSDPVIKDANEEAEHEQNRRVDIKIIND